MNYTATYSPEDNKLRLYASSRLPEDVYARVKAAGFAWAPKQDLFVAPMWTPARHDLLVELAGEVGDEDTSLVERAEARAERFGEYHESRTADAEQARKAVAAIADNIPLGQPILIGHHSERHARKDAERIENGMRRAVKMWDTAQYWKDRAAGALRDAKYKERPDVRARRIKKIESDLRRVERTLKQSRDYIQAWELVTAPRGVTKKDGSEMTAADWAETRMRRALNIANADHVSKCFPLADFPRDPPASQYEGMMSLWSALTDHIITPEQAVEIATRVHNRGLPHYERWAEHYRNRLAYERAMLGEAGGTEADKNKPMKGGACKCWASPRGGWSYIQKVNKVSVTVLDNWGNGGANFTRTIPFDKLAGIMSPLEVENARQDGRLIETGDKTGGVGFVLLDSAPPPKPDHVCPDGAGCPDPKCIEERQRQGIPTPAAADFDAMRASLRAGVKVVTANQLFPTPNDVAARMVDLADIQPGHSVLEPSAGTGALLGAMGGRMFGHNPEAGRVVAVEVNPILADRLRNEFPKTRVHCANFLAIAAVDDSGSLVAYEREPAPCVGFDRIVMNPPFENGADIKHIRHAMKMLHPGGKLVAICANGPRQQEQLQPLADSWEELPPGTFTGTNVGTVLCTFSI